VNSENIPRKTGESPETAVAMKQLLLKYSDLTRGIGVVSQIVETGSRPKLVQIRLGILKGVHA
jgi:hypothetical protein